MTMLEGVGHCATTEKSLAIESVVKKAAYDAYIEVRELGYDIIWADRLDSENPKYKGCRPDGGCFFYGNNLIATVEAKFQKDKGNAIERAYSNHIIINTIFGKQNKISSLYFCAGESSCDNNDENKEYENITKTLAYLLVDVTSNGMIEKGFNEYHPGATSVFLFKHEIGEDHYQTIKTVIKEALIERCKTIMRSNHSTSGLEENEDLLIKSSVFSILKPNFTVPQRITEIKPRSSSSNKKKSSMPSPSSVLEQFSVVS